MVLRYRILLLRVNLEPGIPRPYRRKKSRKPWTGWKRPEQNEETQDEPEPAGEPDGAVSAETLAARWPALMQDMKDRRQAPAAAGLRGGAGRELWRRCPGARVP